MVAQRRQRRRRRRAHGGVERRTGARTLELVDRPAMVALLQREPRRVEGFTFQRPQARHLRRLRRAARFHRGVGLPQLPQAVVQAPVIGLDAFGQRLDAGVVGSIPRQRGRGDFPLARRQRVGDEDRLRRVQPPLRRHRRVGQRHRQVAVGGRHDDGGRRRVLRQHVGDDGLDVFGIGGGIGVLRHHRQRGERGDRDHGPCELHLTPPAACRRFRRGARRAVRSPRRRRRAHRPPLLRHASALRGCRRCR